MLPQLGCLLCVRVCLLQVLSMPLILTRAVVFLALSHRCQQCKSTMVLQKYQLSSSLFNMYSYNHLLKYEHLLQLKLFKDSKALDN